MRSSLALRSAALASLAGLALACGSTPIDLTIDPTATADLQAIWELNTHENFRWTDLRIVNYAAGVFDTTPTASEPVVSFGANSGRLFFER